MQRAVHALRTKAVGFNQAVITFVVPRATLKKYIDGINNFAKDGKRNLGGTTIFLKS